MKLDMVGGPFDGDIIDLNDDDSNDETVSDFVVIPAVKEGNGRKFVLNSLYVRAENGKFYFKETKKDERFTVTTTRLGDS